MIIQTTKEINGVVYDYTCSDSGMKILRDGVEYDEALDPAGSGRTYTESDAPSLFAKVLIPDENVIPEWVQPDSTNPYMTGDKVMYDGKVWVSTIDNNVWSPSTYGWQEIME